MADFDLAKIGAGVVGGAIGSTVAARTRQTTPRELLTAIIGGIGFGAFVPPLLLDYYANMPPMLCGAIGFMCGMSVFGLVALVQKVTMHYASQQAKQWTGYDQAKEEHKGGDHVSG